MTGLTYVEVFTWVEGGFGLAHEHPDVLMIWEAMDPLLEERDGRPKLGVPPLRAGGCGGVTAQPQGIADLEALESVFGALAHQSRRTILLVLLARGGEMTSGDIAGRFDCSWPTTTRHLRILEDARALVHAALRGEAARRTGLDRRDRLRSVAGGWLARFEAEALQRGPRADQAERAGREAAAAGQCLARGLLVQPGRQEPGAERVAGPGPVHDPLDRRPGDPERVRAAVGVEQGARRRRAS